jgi:thiol-disulfide isomerase/thioredoxin
MKTMFKKLSLSMFLLSCIALGTTKAQTIRVKVTGQKDTTVHLIKYFGSKLFYADTAEMKNGEVVFQGKKQAPGIVALLLPGQRYFEFLYNNEDVHIETNGPEFVQNMKIKKSEENKVFIPYVNFISTKKQQVNKLFEDRKNIKDTASAEYRKLSKDIDATNKEVIDYQKKLIAEHPNKLAGKLVLMSMDIDVPEAPKDAKGNILDSNFRFMYFRKHYWDNVDLRNDALANNPIFQNKMEFYFSKNMVMQHWDSVINHAFEFIDRLDPKSRMFELVVGWVASTYGKSEIMGMDKVYLYMLKKYFCTKNAEGKSPAFWVAEDKFKDLCDNIDNKINLVMGVRPPNLILRDTSDTKWVNMYDIKADYTILYFWDPECGHCKKVTPKLNELYEKKLKARNVEVYAIGKAVGKDFVNWKKFIRENKLSFINVAVTDKLYEDAKKEAEKFVPLYPGEKGKPTTLESLNYQTTYDIFSTPVVYILDKDKKIIAKRLSISQIEDFLDNMQNKKNEPKLFPPDAEEDEHMKNQH